MNQNTRQRVVGIFVLALLALIFLPILFDGEGSYYQSPVETRIPAAPPQPEANRRLPQRPVITADTDDIRISTEDSPQTAATDAPDDTDDSSAEAPPALNEEQTADTVTTDQAEDMAGSSASVAATGDGGNGTTASSSPAPSLDERGLPEAWSVRLGAFGNENNARNLVTRLQDAGHRAYSRELDTSQGRLTAVFVGPLVERSAAQSLLEQLRSDFQLNGMIVRYEIEE